ncbi:DUF3169 family protein [Streptococcus panodentis]|uniref:DUF3169 domain-containing protein n=1 Tax=Streptococcus panodentis TaxID=1581472 RepID=A0ABS5AUB7_9STRE|nr:DUF3169 domain-containing protein [Streptococcus panodentis]
MKEQKRISTQKRVLYNIFLLLVGALIGGLSGFFSGLGVFENFSWSSALNVGLLRQFGRASLVILYPLVFFLIYRTRKYHEAYEKEADEEQNYEWYRLTFKNLEYAAIVFNISSAIILFTIFVGIVFIGNITNHKSPLQLSLIDYAIAFLYIILQAVFLKTVQKVRHYKLSAFPTTEEIKEFVLSYDESELQANYEQCYLILFNLNQRLLPALYIILGILGAFTPLNVVSGFVVLMVIHIYINLMYYPMVRKYFK